MGAQQSPPLNPEVPSSVPLYFQECPAKCPLHSGVPSTVPPLLPVLLSRVHQGVPSCFLGRRAKGKKQGDPLHGGRSFCKCWGQSNQISRSGRWKSSLKNWECHGWHLTITTHRSAHLLPAKVAVGCKKKILEQAIVWRPLAYKKGKHKFQPQIFISNAWSELPALLQWKVYFYQTGDEETNTSWFCAFWFFFWKQMKRSL